MFNLNRFKNWTKSSVVDDKRELTIYQKFEDQFLCIKNKTEEYLSEQGSEDRRLLVDFNGRKVSLSYLECLKSNLLTDRTLTVEQRAYKVAEVTRLHQSKVKELEDRVLALALSNPNNTYLAYIKSCIDIINSMLREYASLLAIQRSGVFRIDGSDIARKLKLLKDSIDIRTAEINSRLSLEENNRGY